MDELTQQRRDIRREWNIPTPRMRCPRCGSVSTADNRKVSVRSLLYELKNRDRISETAFEELDRSWKKHRAEHDLDAYGHPADAPRPGHVCTQVTEPEIEAEPDPIAAPRRKLGRNEKCWCGSGRKYKRCHYDADRA